MSKPENFPNNFEVVQLSPVLVYKAISTKEEYHWYDNATQTLSEAYSSIAAATEGFLKR